MISSQALGERITSIRKARGLTQAQLASKLGVARTTLVAIEKGERRPANPELVELSRILTVSLHELLRPQHTSAEVAPRFHLPAIPGADPEDLRQAAETLRTMARRFVELERRLGLVRPPAPLETVDTYRVHGSDGDGALAPRLAGENAAATVRNALALGDGPAVALDERLAVEMGLRIFYLDEIPAAAAGILLWGEELGGVIGINRRHPHERRRWTLAHEVGHFLRDREAGDVLPSAGHQRRDAAEVFADAFASCFLLPRGGIAKQFTDRCRVRGGAFTVADLLSMAALYEVPFQSITRCLEELTLLPRRSWERITAHKSGRGGMHREPATLSQAERPPGLPSRYVDLAIDAYAKELISEGELAEYLETDRVSARAFYHQLCRKDLGDGIEVVLDLTEDVLEAA
ncbi:MAG: ImmA/IrrE family metallo-endopeptidase [bacterium]|nr:ImmA/IrrE family metallo-endopeptidase [bacterium]